MFIAFEGPDNVGKSTSAKTLAYPGQSFYQATKEMHRVNTEVIHAEKDLVVTYDRIDWLSHMVYRLALPDRDWKDDRPRTVFAMPETHLVFKLHAADLADFTADEVVDTPIKGVNEMYYYQADFLMGLNTLREYSLYKSVTIVEVRNDQATGEYSQRVAGFSAPGVWPSREHLASVNDDTSLLELLRSVEHNS